MTSPMGTTPLPLPTLGRDLALALATIVVCLAVSSEGSEDVEVDLSLTSPNTSLPLLLGSLVMGAVPALALALAHSLVPKRWLAAAGGAGEKASVGTVPVQARTQSAHVVVAPATATSPVTPPTPTEQRVEELVASTASLRTRLSDALAANQALESRAASQLQGERGVVALMAQDIERVSRDAHSANQTLRAQLAAASSLNHTLAAQVEELRAEVQDKEAALRASDAFQAAMRRKASGLQGELSALRQEARLAAGDLAAASSLNHALAAQVEEQGALLHAADNKCRALQARVVELEATNGELVKGVGSLEETAAQLFAQFEANKAQQRDRILRERGQRFVQTGGKARTPVAPSLVRSAAAAAAAASTSTPARTSPGARAAHRRVSPGVMGLFSPPVTMPTSHRCTPVSTLASSVLADAVGSGEPEAPIRPRARRVSFARAGVLTASDACNRVGTTGSAAATAAAGGAASAASAGPVGLPVCGGEVPRSGATPSRFADMTLTL